MNIKSKFNYLLATTALAMSVVSGAAQADGKLMPYVLAYSAKGDVVAEAGKLRSKLQAAGFEVLGGYAPYAGAYVMGVTNPAMKQAAAKEKMGGFAAVEHVSVTDVAGSLQVSYLNPAYLYPAYRVSASAEPLAAALKAAIGAEKTFGSAEGKTAKQLVGFNYMVGMEHFDDFYSLGSHKSYDEAVKTVEANLNKGVGGSAMVYKLELPLMQQTVFGVSFAAVTDQRANDKHMMFETVEPNFPIKTTAYMPYQIVVSGNQVFAQHMRFRMAVWHPDLTMVTFGKLMSSPGAIGELLTKVAAGKQENFGF